jgi:photosystem II PsbZ protein
MGLLENAFWQVGAPQGWDPILLAVPASYGMMATRSACGLYYRSASESVRLDQTDFQIQIAADIPPAHGVYKQICCFPGRTSMVILFQLFLLALVAMSFVMVVGVPVLYASNTNPDRNNKLILVGGLIWVGLVLAVAGLNYFVV